MGYDVYGLNPKENTPKPAILSGDVWKMEEAEKKEYFEASNKWEAENKGVYFRNNVWWWRPLWDYVCEVCEDVMSQEDIEAGWSNSGYEITEATVDRMVEKLVVEVALDNHKKHQEKYMEELKNLPKEKCELCKGTGERNDEYVQGKCNGCQGKGERDNFATNYPFSTENVEEFIAFLSESGGIKVC